MPLFRFASFAVLAALLTAVVNAGNQYPVILVHGFGGWGRDEMLGFKYWGGFHGDYEAKLRDQGYDVHTAVVGPFSSNWDRACELYAQIKGGTVNYGPRHSAFHNHSVTGRTFPGLVPEWGSTVNGSTIKVHLVGHSMGGQTIRMLAQLLAHGSKGAPVEEDPESHPLFAGGKQEWVHSITTISTPNQGTLLADGLTVIGDKLQKAVAGIFGIAGLFGRGSAKLFDAKLDHWGVAPRSGNEGIEDYIKRVFQSKMFRPGFKDVCLHSLSTTGAAEENAWVQTLPGSSFAIERGFPQEWQANDGVVNTPSMRSDGSGEVVSNTDLVFPGRWHHLGEFNPLDHVAVVGLKPFKNVFDVYSSHVRLLHELPSHVEGRRLEDGTVVDVVEPTVLADLQQAIDDVNKPEHEVAACDNPEDELFARVCQLMRGNV